MSSKILVLSSNVISCLDIKNHLCIDLGLQRQVTFANSIDRALDKIISNSQAGFSLIIIDSQSKSSHDKAIVA